MGRPRGPTRAFLVVAGATAVLAGCLATAPLFLSTAATAAARVDLQGRCPGLTGANFRGPFESRSDVDSILTRLATNVPGAKKPIFTDESTPLDLALPHDDGVFRTAIVVERSGASDHLHLLTHAGADGVYVPDWFASAYHVQLGQRLGLHGGEVGNEQVRIVGVYRDVVSGPDASFWCSLEPAFQTTPFGDHKAPVLILDDRGAATHGSLFLQGETIWELPLASRPTARSIAGYVAHFGPLQRAGAQIGAHYFAGVLQAQVVSNLDSVVHRAQQIRSFTGASIAPVRWSGALTGGALVLAAALLFERRNRREYRIRVLRGARPAVLGSTAAARAAPAVVLGALAGTAGAALLIGAFGPSSDIDSAAVGSALRYAGLSVAVTLVVIGVTVAVATRTFDRARRRSRAGWRRIPFELAGAVASFVAFRHLVDRGGAALAGADATRIDPLAVFFPLLLIWSVLVALGRPAFALLRRGRTFGERARPAVMLGLRRGITDPAIGMVTSAAVAFCLATFVYASLLSSSIGASLQAKARTMVGADLRVGMTSAPHLDPGIAEHATSVTRAQGTFGATDVTVLGVEPQSFAKIAFWRRSFGPGPIDHLLTPLRDPEHGPIPVVIAGTGLSPPGIARLAIDAGGSTTARVVARARLWPSAQLGEIVVVVDRAALARRHLHGVDEVWLRGLPHVEPARLARPGSGVIYSVPLSSVLDFNNTLPVRWSLGLLGAIGGVAGLAFAAVELAIVDSRARARRLAYLLWRRMGMSERQHRLACAVELGLPALLGAGAAVLIAALTVRITIGHVDALGSLPPPVGFVMAFRPLVTGLLVALAVLVALVGWSERVTRSGDPLELIRVAE